MGTTIVFVYLLIAALVAPILWLIWWGAGSVADTRRRPAAALAAANPPQARATFAFPEVVDLNLPSRTDGVVVYSTSGRELSSCPGPDSAGGCSRPVDDGTVPCSGCVLALPRPIRGSFEWQIPANYRACLLGSYAVFRQAR